MFFGKFAHPFLRKGLVLGISLLLFVTSALAHPDLLARIAQVTAQLEKPGDHYELYLTRADLYRRHAQFEEALADISEADHIKPDAPATLFSKAQVLCDMGQAGEARNDVQKFLAANTNQLDALILRARCNIRLDQREAAIADYSFVISNSPAPGPDLVEERARAQARLGRLADAVAGLDEGFAKCGEVPSLQLLAIDYERQRKNFAGALDRVDKIIARFPVKEPWLTLRAEILEQSGRLAEARDTFQEVLAGIDKYSEIRKGLDLTQQLQARAQAGLARVQAVLSKS